MTDLYFR